VENSQITDTFALCSINYLCRNWQASIGYGTRTYTT